VGLTGKLALLVDDDEVMVTVVSHVLESAGVSVISATSLFEARQVLERLSPNLIILDLRLSGESGLDLLRESKVLIRQIPVLLVSANADSEVVDLGLALGARDFLAKPLEPARLLQKIRKTLEADTFATLVFSEKSAPVAKAKMEVTIQSAVELGFRLIAGVRLAPNVTLSLTAPFANRLGFAGDIALRSDAKRGSLVQRGSFLNQLRLPGLNEEQVKQFELLVKSWHTK